MAEKAQKKADKYNPNHWTLEVTDNNGKLYKAKVRAPEFKELSTALGMLKKNENGTINMAPAGEFLLQSCWVSGDEDIKNNAKLLLSAALAMATEVDVYEAELKKN